MWSFPESNDIFVNLTTFILSLDDCDKEFFATVDSNNGRLIDS